MDGRDNRYGIWSSVSKKFIFGISEPSKQLAKKRLRDRLGWDSLKYRFSVRVIPQRKGEAMSVDVEVKMVEDQYLKLKAKYEHL